MRLTPWMCWWSRGVGGHRRASAGIDMALWIVGQWYDPAFAREVQRYIEYQPAPPYSAEL